LNPFYLSRAVSRRSPDKRNHFIAPPSAGITALQAKNSNSNDDEKKEDEMSNAAWILGLVLPLWLVYISNQWSRSSLYYLVDFSSTADAMQAMNVDIGFSEAQYGILASLAFTSLFAFASLAAGIISDRFNRKTITVAAAVAWSVATLGTAFSTSYPEVLAWRVCMGLGM